MSDRNVVLFPGEIAEIVCRYRRGESSVAIGRTIGRSAWFVRRVLRDAGEPLRSQAAAMQALRPLAATCRACGILVEAADCEVLDGACDDCRHMATLRARLRGEPEDGAIERWMAANELDAWCKRIMERRAA